MTKALRGAFVVVAAAAVFAVAAQWNAQAAVLSSSSSGSFKIRGSASGLVPGRPVALPVTVVNGYSFPLVVTSITVGVKRAGRSCSGANVHVTAFRGSLRVPARSTRKLGLEATLSRAAPDACAAAQFPLRYSGKAIKG
jgi:hypothetical protein